MGSFIAHRNTGDCGIVEDKQRRLRSETGLSYPDTSSRISHIFPPTRLHVFAGINSALLRQIP